MNEAVDPIIQEKMNSIYKIETRFAILMTIARFGSSNIRKISQILGRNESTIYHHIKELLKEPTFLVIDEKATHQKKGIFYALSEEIKAFIREPPSEIFEDKFPKKMDDILKKNDEEIAEFYISLISKHPNLGNNASRERVLFAYNHILERFLITNFHNAEQAFLNGKVPVNKCYPVGSLSNTSIDLKISSYRQHFEVLKEIAHFFGNISKLKKKFSEEHLQNDILEEDLIDLHFHIVGGEIAEFKFKDGEDRNSV